MEIYDADKERINVGDVLYRVTDHARGVVRWVGNEEGKPGPMLAVPGDICVELNSSTTNVTNQTREWRHIWEDAWTQRERFLSWALRHKTSEGLESYCISGIVCMMPSRFWTTSVDSYPDNISDALQLLSNYMSTLSELAPVKPVIPRGPVRYVEVHLGELLGRVGCQSCNDSAATSLWVTEDEHGLYSTVELLRYHGVMRCSKCGPPAQI